MKKSRCKRKIGIVGSVTYDYVVPFVFRKEITEKIIPRLVCDIRGNAIKTAPLTQNSIAITIYKSISL